ncbi:uncharacterized protein BXZ73DRAFT_82907 [Epithele typhae]|uniref:uncharacterized protein n=1 Tax=Epithele typhae TaxID=378194 RepID=UPI002007F59A|nr:uncharacterized protein BXZ73DRAFT_82907 [Epithele typhae]KAH9911286.1 hypothetical protein BXZ73DRAFT_82907 [Epithele typhae]
MIFAPLAILAAVLGACRARGVNRTIDDYYGDSVTGVVPMYYTPPANWTDGNTCANGCHVNRNNVDTSKAFNRTWHDSTWYPGHRETGDQSIAITFNGTAVWVYLYDTGKPT